MPFDSIGDVMTNMLLQWAHPAEAEEGDYRDDEGILICGKCNQAKETPVEIAGNRYIAACMCQCQTDAYELEKQRMALEQRLMYLRQLPIYGLHDKTISDKTFAAAEPNIYLDKCKQFADAFKEVCGEGLGLMLCGPVGCGKTFAAACIANELIKKGVGVLVTSFPAILKAVIPINEIIQQSDAFDLIVVDDLGAERDTDYAAEIVYQFIDNRYKVKLPLIVTTNLAPADMQNQTDVRYRRIYDRVQEMCIPMVMKGANRREANRKTKAALLRQIING